MYHISHFKASDDEEVWAFMQAHPFVIITGVDSSGKQIATHIPVLPEKRNDSIWLKAHMMRKQEHTCAFEKNNEVLVLFTGPHCYVSASWYQNPRTASTWNYQAVHARGRLKFLDEAALVEILTELTSRYEKNADSPALVEHMSAGYMSSMLKAIVAFEIEITHIEHVFKMSQNKDEATYNKIIHNLGQGNADEKAVADIMLQRKEKIFGS